MFHRSSVRRPVDSRMGGRRGDYPPTTTPSMHESHPVTVSPYHPSISPRTTSPTIAVAVPPRLGYYGVHHPHSHAVAAPRQFYPRGSPPQAYQQVLPPVGSGALLCHDSNGDESSSPTNVSPRSVVTTHLDTEDGSVPLPPNHFRPIIERETASYGPIPHAGAVAEIVPRRILPRGDVVTPAKTPVYQVGGEKCHQPTDLEHRRRDAENVKEQGDPRPANDHVGRVCTTSPTPQNLRDNPVRLAKVKSELCQYYSSGQRCPFGDRCNYAHGKHELKQRHKTLLQMERSGQIANAGTYLSRPCMTWVSTGCCPFGRRCTSIHDPAVSAHHETAWLPAAPAATNARVIVDPLILHNASAIHWTNPLVPQTIWEHCRPSQRGSGFCRATELVKTHQEWIDTYRLVCNSGCSAFGDDGQDMKQVKKVDELHRLCIVRLMRIGESPYSPSMSGGSSVQSSRLHEDYVFSPTHALHGELCMVLQSRYFLVLDVDFDNGDCVDVGDIVREISSDEHKARTTPWIHGYYVDPSKVVMAHEVVFAPKGDHAANPSIWFDALPIQLGPAQIKRYRRFKQKNKTDIRSGYICPNSDGALMVRTSAADFPRLPDVNPFVIMIPAEINEMNRYLFMGIIEHRIGSLILHRSSEVGEAEKDELQVRMGVIKRVFDGLNMFHDKWMWPKRQGLVNVTPKTKAPPGNNTPFIPAMGAAASVRTWRTFVTNLKSLDELHLSPVASSSRLQVFRSFEPKSRSYLPRLTPFVGIALDLDLPESKTLNELLGLVSSSKWENSYSIHQSQNGNRNIDGTIKDFNLPLSPVPFV